MPCAAANAIWDEELAPEVFASAEPSGEWDPDRAKQFGRSTNEVPSCLTETRRWRGARPRRGRQARTYPHPNAESCRRRLLAYHKAISVLYFGLAGAVPKHLVDRHCCAGRFPASEKELKTVARPLRQGTGHVWRTE